MRTGMESVYTLLDIDRGVPEVWGSKYDVREILRAAIMPLTKSRYWRRNCPLQKKSC